MPSEARPEEKCRSSHRGANSSVRTESRAAGGEGAAAMWEPGASAKASVLVIETF